MSAKHDQVQGLGADRVIDRNSNLVEALGTDSVDVVVDLVAGPQWPQMLEVLKRGGRYVTAGAIAGPIVELDVRKLYLKDLSFFGTFGTRGLGYPVNDLKKQIARILNRCVIHPNFDVDRSTIDVVRICVPIGRSLSDHACFAFALVFIDDALVAFTLNLKFTSESLKCRRRQFPGHVTSSGAGM
ncbi:MAG: zinc-binding dehydrogenase [Proteobacteria bacterium]|nr:zinc-binding dehydrogenase [Pseudomonadota bacterium]